MTIFALNLSAMPLDLRPLRSRAACCIVQHGIGFVNRHISTRKPDVVEQ